MSAICLVTTMGLGYLCHLEQDSYLCDLHVWALVWGGMRMRWSERWLYRLLVMVRLCLVTDTLVFAGGYTVVRGDRVRMAGRGR